MATPRLPPLGALRAFEASARHLSFTKAAQELGVTQAAISHQVKSLEQALGATLFRRLTRALALTDTGVALAPELTEAFERMGRAVTRAQEREARGNLRVSLLYTFALAFLVPRLGRFSARHPEITLKLETSSRVIDFDREPFDAGIRYGPGPYPPLHADLLFEDEFTPLCSPEVARKIKKPADVLAHKLPDDHNYWDDWAIWLKAAGLDPETPRSHSTIFDSTRLAVEAAMEGQGLALGAPFLFENEIKSGRLVAPLDLIVPAGKSYWLVCPKRDAERPVLAAFRHWLLAETKPLRERKPPRA
ncbi:MAG: transcriptional regulator GcvA [Tagaea sp.]|nr:transcriptional regulator GcvA [Tagaea sp.]